MNWNKSSLNALRRLRIKKRLTGCSVLIFFTLFFWPTASFAAECCICTHPDAGDGIFCLKKNQLVPCESLGTLNTELASAHCQLEIQQTQCRSTSAGGICINNPNTDASTFKLSSIKPGAAKKPAATAQGGSSGFSALPIKLNIDLPGLKFTDPYLETKGEEQNIVIPYFAQYVSAAMKVLMSMSLIAAAVMIVYGGYLYILSGMHIQVKEGKKIIVDALIGLVILLGSYLILANINPNTLKMTGIKVSYVEYEPFEYEPKIAGVGVEGGAEGGSGGGSVSTASRQEVIDAVLWAAHEVGVNDCAFLAICQHESGFKNLWTGAPRTKPENVGAHGPCGTLTRFLLEDGKYSQAMRAKFPDMPPKGTSKADMGIWLVNNPKAAAYYGALMFKGKSSNPVMALDQYSSGGALFPIFLKSRPGCDQTIKHYDTYKKASQGISDILHCLPDSGFIAVPTPKCLKYDNNKKCIKTIFDPDSTCAPTYECLAKPNNKGEFRGKCPGTDKDCLAMKMSDFIPYVLKHYPAMKALGCTAEN